MCEPLEDRRRRDRGVRARRRPRRCTATTTSRSSRPTPGSAGTSTRSTSPSTAGTTRSTPASSSTTSATIPHFTRLLADLGVADPADRDELRRLRRSHRPRVLRHEPQHPLRPAPQPPPPVVPPPPHRDRPLQPRRAEAGRRRARVDDRRPAPAAGEHDTQDEESLARLRRAPRLLRRPRAAIPRAVRRVDLVGRPGDRSPSSRSAPTRASCTTTACSRCEAGPQWRTITGGSRTYVDALVAPFADRIRVATPVQKIVPREQTGTVEILTEHGPESFDRVVVAAHSNQALRLLGDPTPAERNVLGCHRLPAQHRDAPHRPVAPAGEPTSEGQLELRDRRPGAGERHRHLLDEPPPVDRLPPPAPRHPQPPRRDRRPPRPRRARVRPPRLRRRRDRRPARPPPHPGRPRHLLRRRLLGLRIPRGRRAERARGRRRHRGRADDRRSPPSRRSTGARPPARAIATRAGRALRGRRHPPAPHRTGARLRAAALHDPPRRRRAPRVARPVPGLVRATRRAPIHFRNRDFLDGGDASARRRRPRPRRGVPRSPPDRLRHPARAPPHVRVAVQPDRRLLLLVGHRRRARRGRPRGHEHAVGRPALVRGRRARRQAVDDGRQGDARLAVPPDGRASTGSPGRRRATTCASASTSPAPAPTSSTPTSASTGSRSTVATPSRCRCATGSSRCGSRSASTARP